jgi:hypothetical protein
LLVLTFYFSKILLKIQQQKAIPLKTNYLGVKNWLAPKKSELCTANTEVNEIDLTLDESNEKKELSSKKLTLQEILTQYHNEHGVIII